MSSTARPDGPPEDRGSSFRVHREQPARTLSTGPVEEKDPQVKPPTSWPDVAQTAVVVLGLIAIVALLVWGFK